MDPPPAADPAASLLAPPPSHHIGFGLAPPPSRLPTLTLPAFAYRGGTSPGLSPIPKSDVSESNSISPILFSKFGFSSDRDNDVVPASTAIEIVQTEESLATALIDIDTNHSDPPPPPPPAATANTANTAKRKRRKPPMPYPLIIARSILESPHLKLTLKQLYDDVELRYPELFSSEDSGWQNTIRHNLSVNKIFHNVARDAMISPTEDQDLHNQASTATTRQTASSTNTRGKGGYWCIVGDLATLHPSLAGYKPGIPWPDIHQHLAPQKPSSKSSSLPTDNLASIHRQSNAGFPVGHLPPISTSLHRQHTLHPTPSISLSSYYGVVHPPGPPSSNLPFIIVEPPRKRKLDSDLTHYPKRHQTSPSLDRSVPLLVVTNTEGSESDAFVRPSASDGTRSPSPMLIVNLLNQDD